MPLQPSRKLAFNSNHSSWKKEGGGNARTAFQTLLVDLKKTLDRDSSKGVKEPSRHSASAIAGPACRFADWWGPLALRRKWILAVGVALAYPAVLAMDEQFRALTPGPDAASFNRFGLRSVDRADPLIARNTNGPAFRMRDDMLVLSRHLAPQSVRFIDQKTNPVFKYEV